jgi:hypothetical protein
MGGHCPPIFPPLIKKDTVMPNEAERNEASPREQHYAHFMTPSCRMKQSGMRHLLEYVLILFLLLSRESLPRLGRSTMAIGRGEVVGKIS